MLPSAKPTSAVPVAGWPPGPLTRTVYRHSLPARGVWSCPTSVARRAPLEAVDVGAADPAAVVAVLPVALVRVLGAVVFVVRDAGCAGEARLDDAPLPHATRPSASRVPSTARRACPSECLVTRPTSSASTTR
jgi:hypothetical protein